MAITTLIPRYAKLGEGFSKKEQLKANEHGGRTTKAHAYQSPTSWLDFLISNRKSMILCTFCRHKFNPKQHNYRRFYCVGPGMTDPYRTDGQCEVCKEDTRRSPGGGTMFIPEEGYKQLCHEPRRAGGRWNLRTYLRR